MGLGACWDGSSPFELPGDPYGSFGDSKRISLSGWFATRFLAVLRGFLTARMIGYERLLVENWRAAGDVGCRFVSRAS